ncbi:hypothetical protein AVEN_132905-1 [Araneus ventricosus]|uniref:Uncharacterized protein n=1 Tax=Araneus ventricosus TaxID=182803 RepID=A0A4Y2M7A5_ARAVE|nr:hypothetical protein AVEN_132905-1 [Araneus ventricosus]
MCAPPVADLLAKEGSALPSAASDELFVSEIFSIHRAKANSTWKVPPHTNGMLEIVLVCSTVRRVQLAQWLASPLRNRLPCGKLAASSFHGDFGAFVNLLQACTLVMTNLWQTCTLVMTNLWQTCTLDMTNL